MGRWLNRIENWQECVPTKLTKPSSVSFVSSISSTFQDEKFPETNRTDTLNSKITENNPTVERGSVSFVGSSSSLFLHRKHKRALRQGRLEILKLILLRILKAGNPATIFVSADEHELFTDNVLIGFKYDLEKAIDYYRSIAPEPPIILAQCVKCGYRPLFCSCHT